jgi:hypothetical protein
MMRLGLPAICGLLVLCLAGCGTGVDGPSTQVEILNIAANLPGTDWHKESEEKLGTMDSERWENGDGTLFFRVSADMDDLLSVPSVDSARVDYYKGLVDYPSSTMRQRSYFVGRDAVRLEAVSPEDGEYHIIEYVFVAGLRQFYVGAGATNETWDKGGADSVDAILQNVKIDIVK